jgi:hypothetical protein
MAQTVRFDRDIRPILSDKCFPCHGPGEEHREADLRLDLESAAKESVIVPEKANESELVRRILAQDADEMMPPPAAKKPLETEEIDLLKRWVEQGAEWTDHWAFLPPVSPEVPDAVAALGDADSKRLETGKWQHVNATYDGSSKAAGIKIFVNGESWERDTQQAGLKDTIGTKKSLLIGSRHPDARGLLI